MTDIYYVGVDVGTSSVRAALVLHCGDIQRIHSVPITVSNPKLNFYEQDSEEIWQAVCESVKVCLSLFFVSFILFCTLPCIIHCMVQLSENVFCTGY